MRGRRRPGLRIALAIIGVGAVAMVGGLLAFGPRLGIWLIPPSPERYGQDAIRLLDGGLYADGPEWSTARAHALTELRSADTLAEADAVLARAATVAGGHHSFLLSADSPSTGTAAVDPTVTIDDGIATAVVPEFSGGAQEGRRYADTLADGLSSAGVCGVVVDLRGNGGGDMGPMIAGLAALIPDGVTSSFVIGDQVTDLRLADGRFTGGGTPTSTEAGAVKLDLPVAVLTDPGTGSSGEQVLIALRGHTPVRSFGEPTAGYASVNRSYPLYSGSTLVLTVGETRDRAGNSYGDQPIAPDDLVDAADAPERAAEWLRSQCGATAP